MKKTKEIEPLPILSDKTRKEFVSEIASVINRFSIENCSNTPDFILAEHVTQTLEQFAHTSRDREKWYGKELKI